MMVLKPDALQKLNDSGEFFHDRDNTIYHRGYPLKYRQDGAPRFSSRWPRMAVMAISMSTTAHRRFLQGSSTAT